MIYLDNATTTGPKPQGVYKAVQACMETVGASPGRGGHAASHIATQILAEARQELAALFKVSDPSHIVFTLNATDAMNTALFGFLKTGDRVVTTSMEHNAVARPLRYLESLGVSLTIVPCDRYGRLDVPAMKKKIAAGADAVVMTHASNVTGTIMPVKEIGQYCRRHNTKMIVDASQTAGVETIDCDEMAIDMLVFSGHKGLLGPQGTGGLYIGEGLYIRPLRFGGTGSASESDTQPEFFPDRFESGSPNVPGIAGLSAGIRFIKDTGIGKIRDKERQLADRLLKGLSAIPGIRVFGPSDLLERTSVVSFIVKDKDMKKLGDYFYREFGIACRAGLHCAPWAHRTIGTIDTGTIRFSPGYFNTEEEMDQAIRAVEKISQPEK